MIAYRFGQEDLLRTRFAISPLMEISGSFEAAREPERFPVHAPWTAWARPRVGDHRSWPLLGAVIPRGARSYPDFVSPPPRAPRAALEEELSRVRATPAAQVEVELRRAYPDGLPRAARRLLADPDAGLDGLVAEMRAWWDAVLAPHWDAILAMLEAEIASRGRRLTAVGPGAAFADLADEVRWRDGTVEVRVRARRQVDLGGRGLLLVPAAFAWPVVWPMVDAPWQPAIVYAPRGVAALWEPREDDGGDGALRELLGARRARILAALERPASTLELAHALGASPAGVSEHLGVLRRAGLVAGRREGRRVLYARTRAGDAVVRAPITR